MIIKMWMLTPDGSYYDLSRDGNDRGVPTGAYGHDWIVVMASEDAARDVARQWNRDGFLKGHASVALSEGPAKELFS